MIIIYTFYGETIGEGDIILSKSIKVIKETMFSYQHSKEARSMKITGSSLYYYIIPQHHQDNISLYYVNKKVPKYILSAFIYHGYISIYHT